ncbi:AfsR/SARP family transcriptional regulator [Streptomyces sp. MAR4 CNX-425]|uniref:AfsR/SARP family transcriptional regulator n=1 Tax=Streptomyces sp. MAR4 CNX-425 TaxID=3406343 RepID=UPI003B5118FC
MLASLALDARRVISFEELAEELWAGRALANTRNALQAHATRIRRLLDSPDRQSPATTVVRAVGGGYLLDVPPECVDTNRFLTLAGKGFDLVEDRPAQAIEHFQAGLRLWRGPALVDAGDGLRCRSAATSFEERRLTVWEDLARARLAVGDESRAIAELQQLVFRYPLRERFCELLMLALYRAGRQGDALETYRRTRRRLDEELGVDPGGRLKQRHHEILSQDPALALPGALWSGRLQSAGTAC